MATYVRHFNLFERVRENLGIRLGANESIVGITLSMDDAPTYFWYHVQWTPVESEIKGMLCISTDISDTFGSFYSDTELEGYFGSKYSRPPSSNILRTVNWLSSDKWNGRSLYFDYRMFKVDSSNNIIVSEEVNVTNIEAVEYDSGSSFVYPVTITIVTVENANVTFSASPSNGGTISNTSGTYSAGSVINLIATPSANYVFDRWGASRGQIIDVFSASTNYVVPPYDASVTCYFSQARAEPNKAGRYNGSAFEPVIQMYSDGSSWVECELERYNGSSWDNVDTQ